MERNEFNHIQCRLPQLFYNGNYYLDYSSFVEVSGLNSTSLFRTLKAIPDVPKIRYKNRSYFLTEFVFTFWRHVSDANKNRK